jgi:hypothetical protein
MEGARELTDLGRQQHFAMGKYIKNKYINELKFLKKSYRESDIYV